MIVRLKFWTAVLLTFAGAATAMADEIAVVVAGQPGAERFRDTAYLYLGQQDIALTFETEPRDDYVLELLWGAKNDRRGAAVEIDGTEVARVRDGGYDGFQWRRVVLAQPFGGQQRTIHLKALGPQPAFIAAARLCLKTDPPMQNEAPGENLSSLIPQVSIRKPHTSSLTAVPRTLSAPSPNFATPFDRAAWNAARANEAFVRSLRMTRAWLKLADPTTGLIPRNLKQAQWHANDNAADTFPFLALTAWFADRQLYDGPILDMLESEQRHTNRLDRLSDTYDFARQGFAFEKPDLDRITFGSTEYIKDGLIMLVEALGRDNAWMRRMTGIADDLWKHARIETPYGKIPSTNVEVNGDLLQVMSRLYFVTGDDKYLDWAIRLGDYYLLGDRHPTRRATHLALRDHGCEIISGLCELYVAVHFARPEKQRQYRPHIHEMLDCILKVGRNEHGMMYVWVHPQTGEHSTELSDTWGYNYNGLYSVYLVDGTPAYRDACRHALANLSEHYRNYLWHPTPVLADGYADSIEGALGLLVCEPVDSAFEWVDSEIENMWAIQREDGIVEGWHGDGNFARTSLMYAFWKTQGTTIHPWRADVLWGAAREGNALYLTLSAKDKPWTGQLCFERPRHQMFMNLPLDYPRINRLAEWFPLDPAKRYELTSGEDGAIAVYTGAQLQAGLEVSLDAGESRRLTLREHTKEPRAKQAEEPRTK